MTGINSVNQKLDMIHIKLSLSKPYVVVLFFVRTQPKHVVTRSQKPWK